VHFGRPTSLNADQENKIVQLVLSRASEERFLRKGELLNQIERIYGKILKYGWISSFLIRHKDQLTIALIQQEVVGTNPRFIFNLDETGCSDWEERKPFDGIIPRLFTGRAIHYAF
jgi:hypothetical protein